MLCHAPGTAWQKACTRACASAAKASGGGEDDAGGAEHDGRRPRAVDADAERARRLVARARRDRHAARR